MKKYILTAVVALATLTSCSLDEQLNDSIGKDNPQFNTLGSPAQSLAFTYTLLEGPGSPFGIWTLNEDSSDEEAKPTRGSDWFDGGKWQQLHLHTWLPSNPQITNSYTDMNRGIAYATSVLGFANATKQQKAEATFLQVYWLWLMTDHFGQTILREPNEADSVPSIYWTRSQAIDNEIAKLEAVINDLPAYTNSAGAGTATKNAGNALLAKLYLNKAVYKATDADGKPQVVTPAAFAAADMDKVIALTTAAMAGTSFTNIAGNTPGQNYFQNFAPDNGERSTEIIFSRVNEVGNGSNVFQFAYMTTHYNQAPGGYNGPSTTTDLIGKFTSTDPNDPRFSTNIPYLTTNSGLKAGILIGQQVNQSGANILTRLGAPLSFTTAFDLASSGEAQGARVIKYYPQYTSPGNPTQQVNTDFIFLSRAECMLMQAEAYARKGNFATANTLIGQLRAARGAAPLAITTLQNVNDEFAREMYWQGTRRTDQIRFGTFLNPVQGRTATTDRHVMVYPIPLIPLNANPKLKQNPGY
ncbi:RagB/SusD family nutrient uptake outer membrane protein [Halpernia frigidisoli]|uniref:Starch-binding associating with outer membrane n=1 Tax=Halpernia frigidisoli TaxID=1125876 RepID=A0A1I3H1H9_9FLAO|nr:RagB/SusD family nutrient uptake outer membrane protein [Halpernia frigidisoli]SFI29541.1 Starch-binding associating with outer membrane [Halpernia frigidisoli]